MERLTFTQALWGMTPKPRPGDSDKIPENIDYAAQELLDAPADVCMECDATEFLTRARVLVWAAGPIDRAVRQKCEASCVLDFWAPLAASPSRRTDLHALRSL